MRRPIDTLDETTPDLEAVGAELTPEAPRRIDAAPHYGGTATTNVSVDADADAEMLSYEIYISHPYQFAGSDYIL